MLNAKTFQTRAARQARWILLFSLQSLAFSLGFAANPAYPLKYNAGQHYLVDQKGVPFFIQGDSPWYLTEAIKSPDVDSYLATRASQGFNAVILDISDTLVTFNNQTNIYGQNPFTGTTGGYTNLATANVNYFTNVDWVINDAAKYGICCFIYPMFLGSPGSGCWYDGIASEPSNSIYQYGAFIGGRYASVSNIVWIGAGDIDDQTIAPIIMRGITNSDTNHLITMQSIPFEPAKYFYTNSFVNLNDTYPRTPAGGGTYITYDHARTNWFYTPTMPSFAREPWYEYSAYLGGGNSPGATGYDCRRYAWGSATWGECGQFYGNANIWPFAANWQTNLTSPGASVSNLIALLSTRSWWSCIPDYSNNVVTAGYGTYGNQAFVTAMREASGKTVIAYVPVGTMTPTVAMNQLAGWSATAWWFNPRTGAGTTIGTYPTTGTQTFTPPDTNDWTLVIDSILSKNAGVHP
ncbi:MAG TPA: DUF4038 domain-containing protein [Candidatus Acidoferrum sp.]|nr:DUF4038 domain-containing protein [Candidatus Acidoferrum sp.]